MTRWQRVRLELWTLWNMKRSEEPRELALRVTHLAMRFREWRCAHLGHKMRPVGAPSTRRICHRCWQHQDGPMSAYDRRQQWLWEQRLTDLIAQYSHDETV